MNAKSSTNASKGVKARKTGSPTKRATKKAASGKKSTSSTPTKRAAEPSLQERIKEAKKLEAIDRADAPRKASAVAKASAAHPLRNSNFPKTYIKEISVKLDDPHHALTLKWTGPQAADQDPGSFRSCPAAGRCAR